LPDAGGGVLSPATPFAFPGILPGQGDADAIWCFAMQRDLAKGRLYALTRFKTGDVFQWEKTASWP